MSVTRHRDVWNYVFTRVLTIATVALSVTAHAQVPAADETPPVRSFIDSNGVDLMTGNFYLLDRQVSVGPDGNGGLTRTYIGVVPNAPEWARDSLMGVINKSGTVYTVSVGAGSYTYSLAGTTFTSLQGDGSTLTLTNSTTYTWVRRDGATGTFSTSLVGVGSAIGNVASLTQMTYPNGEVDTYTYTFHSYTFGSPSKTYGYRLDAVTNNFGYEMKYLYKTSSNVFTDFELTQVIGLNNAVDYCAPTATSCPGLTVTWPSVSFNTSQMTDELGRVTNYFVANPSSTQTLTRPSGAHITVTYDASTRVTALSNGTGTWHYAYSVSGSTLTTTATDPNTHTRVVVTNTSNSTVTSDTDGVGNLTGYAYDSSNRVKTITRQEGDTIGYTYDARGNITQTVNTGKDKVSTITTSANFDTTCTYPAKCNQPNYTIDGKQYETNYSYNNSTGQVMSIIRPTGANGLRPETDFSYTNEYAWYKNSTGSIVEGPSPISLLTKTSQCATAQTCPGTANAVESNYVYGATGVANNLLLTSMTQGAGDGSLKAPTSFAYDAVGNIYTQTDPRGMQYRFRFDAARQLLGVVGPDPDGSGPLHNRAIRNTYECDSTVKSGCDGLVTKTEQGTVLSEADSDWAAFSSLSQTAITYDTVDRKATIISSNGSTYISATQFTYDPGNRLTCQTQRMNPSAITSLPASACTLGTAGSAGPDRITSFTYDNANRLTQSTAGYGTTVQANEFTQTYGGDNEVSTRADAKGNLTTFVPDTFNRISKVEFPTPSNGKVSSTTDYEQYTYDNNGNITQDRRRDGTIITYGYDDLNLRTSGYNGASFGYDNLGRITSAAVTGISESFGYDGLSRQTSEVGPLGTIGRTYDLAGNLTRLTYPDTYYVTYGYDALNEFNDLTDSNSNTLLQKVYDNLGRISSISRTSGPSESRGYGPDLRILTQAYTFSDTSKNVTYSYAFNLAGQPQSMTPSNSLYSNTTSPAAKSYATDGQNRYTTVGGQTMSYDGRSNLTSDGTNSFVFDALNRTTTVNSTNFSFDALNRVYQGVSGSTTNRLLYSGQQVVAAYNGSGTLTNRYVPDVQVDRTLLWWPGSSTAINGASWLINNAFGSVVAGGYSGTAAITTYDAFGVAGPSGLSTYNGNLGFKGMPSLGTVGIYNSRARTYNAMLGRFLQTDPSGYVDGMNLYRFVHNSPVDGSDPTGLDGCSEEIASQNLGCLDEIVVIGHPISDSGFNNDAPNDTPPPPESPQLPAIVVSAPRVGTPSGSDDQSQSPKQTQQQCLDSFNNSYSGAVVNFLSFASPLIGPNRLQSATELVGGGALKLAVYQGLEYTSNSALSIGGSAAEFITGAGAGLAADALAFAAKDVFLPLAVGATAIQLVAHAGCYLSSQ